MADCTFVGRHMKTRWPLGVCVFRERPAAISTLAFSSLRASWKDMGISAALVDAEGRS